MLVSYLNLTKSGIVIFVLLTGFCGYGLGLSSFESMDPFHLALFLLGLYVLSSGSFALNQCQEERLDEKMIRTRTRPLCQKKIPLSYGLFLSFALMSLGLFILYKLEPKSALLGFITLVLYNGFYTLYWKKRWAFAAVPGALPGALPILIGYVATGKPYLTLESAYLFSVMFFWQMPHFWSIALRYKEDYTRAQVPVLPLKLGAKATLFHMGIYLFFYLLLVLMSPLFVNAYLFYLIFVVPMSLKTAWEFLRYSKEVAGKNQSSRYWTRFFIWINLSLIVFVSAPLIDLWLFF